MLSLISALMLQSVTSILPSQITKGTVFDDFCSLYNRVAYAVVDELYVDWAIPLVEQIVRDEFDALAWNVIWHAMFKLFAVMNPVRPSAAFIGEPLTNSLAESWKEWQRTNVNFPLPLYLLFHYLSYT